MSYWFGVGLVVLSAALFGITHPAIFYGDPDGPSGFLDFGDLFYYGQWIGFWVLIGSLGLFAMAQRSSPALFQPWIKSAALAPAAAILLIAHFIVFTMPEASNKRSWKQRNLGVAAYVKAKTGFLRERRLRQDLVKRFAGTWKADDGAVYSFAGDSLRIRRGDVVTEMNSSTCRERLVMTFQMNDPTDLYAEFMGSNEEFRRLFGSMPEQSLPILTCLCDSDFRRFVVLPDGRLAGFLGLGHGFFLKRV